MPPIDQRALDVEALAHGVLAADKASVARALNAIENRRPERERAVAQLLSALASRRDPAHGHRVGITGPPGVGKSSLVAVLARVLRKRGRTVGVVAVDPSSARSGGALLGDRARMAFDPDDAGLFVRSLATQGALGGLAHATAAAVEVLSAAFDVVLVETVGVGQTEIAVAQVADTVALVVQPGSGDVLQFLKAGVMEIPDLLVVNKSDHGPTATRAASDLTVALGTLRQVGARAEVGPPDGQQRVLLASARDVLGIDALADALEAHRAALTNQGVAAQRRAGHATWAREWLLRRVGTRGIEALGGAEAVTRELDATLARGASALHAAHVLSDALAVTRQE